MLLITAIHNYRPHRYQVEQLPTEKNRERWKVTGHNGALILSNNRPLLAQKRLKHWRPEWKVEGQELWNRAFMDALCEAIEGAVRQSYFKVNNKSSFMQ